MHSSRATDICRLHSRLKADRCAWDGAWRDLADYIQPRKAEISYRSDTADFWRQNRLFDGTAIQANMTLAAGCMAWLTPAETPWFAFEAPQALKGIDRVKGWLSDCTERVAYELASSNFYSEIHESYLDRGCFGTSCLFAEAGAESTFHFDAWEIGTFYIVENALGLIDTVFREFDMTVRQARELFGEEALPPKVREKVTKDETKLDDCEQWLHVIRPRENRNPELPDAMNMPFECVYLHLGEKHIVRESGYAELPAFASRFLAWGRHVYGYGPGFVALPEARQVNRMQMNMDLLAEVSANPRIKASATFTGQIDLRAGGLTLYDDDKGPEEWATAGRYDVGKDRVIERQQAIKDAFHVELFQMFAQLEKQMTAREVAERSQEKLVLFSPTFARLTTEVFNPLLLRCFMIAQRKGILPNPPREAIIRDAQGQPMIPFPQVQMTSRLALAMRAIHNTAWHRTLESVLPVVQVNPAILDNFDMDRISRDMSRNEGLPNDWLLDEAKREEIRKQRAQQQQEMMAAEMAMKAKAV